MTHAYFCLYHALANVLIRRVRNHFTSSGHLIQNLAEILVVFTLSYATAYGETLTIAHFPYYSFENKAAMYKTGSLFYAIYFFVSFPMFYRMDEEAGKKEYGLWRVVVDALAAGMIVTCLLDFWRLGVGTIYETPAVAAVTTKAGIFGKFNLPWL
jgi:cycloeucalenol cycloisomerase